jgi:hypothetical protein
MQVLKASAQKQTASSTVREKVQTARNILHRYYYVHRSANIDSCYEKKHKIWIGRTAFPLRISKVLPYWCQIFNISIPNIELPTYTNVYINL